MKSRCHRDSIEIKIVLEIKSILYHRDILTARGSIMTKKKKYVSIVILILLVICVSAISFKTISNNSSKCTYEYSGTQLPTQIGSKERNSMVSTANATGFLTYGPYITLSPGYYEIDYTYSTGSTGNSKPIGYIDIASSGQYVEGSLRDLPPSSYSKGLIRNSINLDKSTDLVEFRLFSNGLTDIELRSICVLKKTQSD
jgi:hypothetical protein